ncbi:MAG: ABC transporter permease [SAR202 cluster bacterium]|jgi:NitT/TauT family transport system permease protein|nr:ABC transporter permease [SAR202 cluster bacterium]MDP6274008.1 ABC transporter permease [Dehalococcoidia bacterium]MDP7345985.1 ABC transporter permease [Anaerolineales bacterium]HJN41131.1 ABC transporter permease [Anaerolineales bacterium]|tara:strand:- start:4930 stop:5760 length:831 start_codon:yes stop_codon:yes gene_type:complete
MADATSPDSIPVVEVPPEIRRQTFRHAVFMVAPFAGLAAFFLFWEFYVRISGIRPLTLPKPSSVLIHVVENPAFYWHHATVTVQEAWWGFWMAFVLAVLVATGMAHSKLVERAATPIIVLMQSMPVAILVPIFLLWFGFSSWPKILTALLFAWIPFVANALTGLRAIDPETHELLKSVNASKWEIYWRLRVPHSLPYLFSAGRICIGLALVGAVVGEFFNSKDGLGNTARVAQSRLLVDQLWGSVFVLAFIGVTFVLVLIAVEHRVLRWHSSQTVV